ncbi:MAG: hypothetical protein H7A40_00930 [Chlamydiales bacterium]|nr:hypothetical protein [Chlamydiales bacterium]
MIVSKSRRYANLLVCQGALVGKVGLWRGFFVCWMRGWGWKPPTSCFEK